MPIIIILAVLLLGGTALHAQGSVPGDALYPLKVHVTENVGSLMAVTARTEASSEINQAINRLEEAEKLSTQGSLTMDHKRNLERSFQAHMNIARDNIDKLRNAGEFTVASDLELNVQNLMAAHRTIMMQISHNTDVDLTSFITKIENEQNTSAYKLENIEGRALVNADLQSAAHGKMIMATNRIDEARKLQLNKTAGLSSDIQIEARASLAAATSLFNQAKDAYEMGAYANAMVLYQNAAHIAQGAETLISTANTLKLSKTPTKNAMTATLVR